MSPEDQPELSLRQNIVAVLILATMLAAVLVVFGIILDVVGWFEWYAPLVFAVGVVVISMAIFFLAEFVSWGLGKLADGAAAIWFWWRHER